MVFRSLIIIMISTFLVIPFAYADATHRDVIKLVKQSSAFITKNGKKSFRQMNNDLNKKWQTGENYIFVVNCKTGKTLIHVKKAVIGVNLLSKLKDKKTGRFFLKDMCEKSQGQPEGIWHTYWWPKPKETQPSRKVSFILRNDRFPNYMIGAGIYSEILDMAKLNTKLR